MRRTSLALLRNLRERKKQGDRAAGLYFAANNGHILDEACDVERARNLGLEGVLNEAIAMFDRARDDLQEGLDGASEDVAEALRKRAEWTNQDTLLARWNLESNRRHVLSVALASAQNEYRTPADRQRGGARERNLDGVADHLPLCNPVQHRGCADKSCANGRGIGFGGPPFLRSREAPHAGAPQAHLRDPSSHRDRCRYSPRTARAARRTRAPSTRAPSPGRSPRPPSTPPAAALQVRPRPFKDAGASADRRAWRAEAGAALDEREREQRRRSAPARAARGGAPAPHRLGGPMAASGGWAAAAAAVVVCGRGHGQGGGAPGWRGGGGAVGSACAPPVPRKGGWRGAHRRALSGGWALEKMV